MVFFFLTVSSATSKCELWLLEQMGEKRNNFHPITCWKSSVPCQLAKSFSTQIQNTQILKAWFSTWFLLESFEILIGPKNYSLNFWLMKISSYGQHPIDSPLLSFWSKSWPEKNDTISVQYIPKKLRWTSCFNEHNYL